MDSSPEAQNDRKKRLGITGRSGVRATNRQGQGTRAGAAEYFSYYIYGLGGEGFGEGNLRGNCP